MKKTVSLVLTLCMLFITSVTAMAAIPKVTVGGETLKSDVAPIIVNDRILLPVRAVFESIGAKVDFVPDERKVVATKKDTTVTLVIDSNVMTINGVEKQMDVAASIKNGRTLVPLRACAEAFNVPIDWDQKTFTAKVRIPVSVVAETYAPGFFGKHHIYTYDERGNMIKEDFNGSITTWAYDDYNNCIRREDKYAVQDYIYTYNENGDIATCEQHSSMEGAPVSKTTYIYDERRNLIEKKDSRGNTTVSYEYDARGNMILQKSPVSLYRYEYDEHDNLIPENLTPPIIYHYDDYGNLLYKTAANTVGTYTYDKENNTLYVDQKFRKKFVYDKNHNIIQIHHDNGNIERFEYDENGNLLYHHSGHPSTPSWEKYIVMVK